jgi:hypothetical protein
VRPGKRLPPGFLCLLASVVGTTTSTPHLKAKVGKYPREIAIRAEKGEKWEM